MGHIMHDDEVLGCFDFLFKVEFIRIHCHIECAAGLPASAQSHIALGCFISDGLDAQFGFEFKQFIDKAFAFELLEQGE